MYRNRKSKKSVLLLDFLGVFSQLVPDLASGDHKMFILKDV